VRITLLATDEAFAELKKKRATLGPLEQLKERMARLRKETLVAAG
jgi:hypothetical protein